tara:strand:+ start:225 stop:728 length:504 start_codon:yes stop_codon:yes gene_type:complete
MASNGTILVPNSGSSSVKFALFDLASHAPHRLRSGALDRIAFDGGRFAAVDVEGTVLVDETPAITNHVTALDMLLGWVEGRISQTDLVAVGHRTVHGGEHCDCSLLVTPILEVRIHAADPACTAPPAAQSRWHGSGSGEPPCPSSDSLLRHGVSPRLAMGGAAGGAA